VGGCAEIQTKRLFTGAAGITNIAAAMLARRTGRRAIAALRADVSEAGLIKVTMKIYYRE
jgi:hypothetical protein